MVVGLRYSLGILWLTLIVAETISSDTGIGYMAMNAREFMQRFTSLLLTHDVEETVALADRLVLLQEGKVAFHIDIRLARPPEAKPNLLSSRCKFLNVSWKPDALFFAFLISCLVKERIRSYDS